MGSDCISLWSLLIFSLWCFFTIKYLVGNHVPWYLPFVHMVHIRWHILTTPYIRKTPRAISVINFRFDLYAINYTIKSPLFSISFFQSALSDCRTRSWNYNLSSHSASEITLAAFRNLVLLERVMCTFVIGTLPRNMFPSRETARYILVASGEKEQHTVLQENEDCGSLLEVS